MQTIYLTFLYVILALGTFLAGVYWRQLARTYRRLIPEKKHKLTTHQRIDELEKEIYNVAQFAKRRQTTIKSKIREEVRNYLKELQK